MDEFFAAVLEATSDRDRSRAEIDQCTTSTDMPGEHAGTNVFPLDRTERIVKLLIEIPGKPLIDEWVKELADVTRQFSGQCLAQSVSLNGVIDILGAVALPVLEVSVNHPIVRQLESRADHVANCTDSDIRIPRTKLRQVHTWKVNSYSFAGPIERIGGRDNHR